MSYESGRPIRYGASGGVPFVRPLIIRHDPTERDEESGADLRTIDAPEDTPLHDSCVRLPT
jgi:hypothetical protein